MNELTSWRMNGKTTPKKTRRNWVAPAMSCPGRLCTHVLSLFHICIIAYEVYGMETIIIPYKKVLPRFSCGD